MRKIVWAVILVAASLSACRQAPVKRHLTVVVSLDAFRWDFTQIHDAPKR